MNWKPLLAGLLAAGLLSGCGAAANTPATLPAIDPQPVATETSAAVATEVSNVRELMDAIVPGAVITLPEGAMNLNSVEDVSYQTTYCWWESVEDGYQLVISGVENLTIQGAGKDASRIQTDPRYAAVLKFENCSGLRLEGFTIGHTEQAGPCEGSVIELGDCRDVTMEDLGIFGCGNVGVSAQQCQNLSIRLCDIYTCSSMGLSLGEVNGCRVTGSILRDLGSATSGEAYCAVSAWGGQDLLIEDTVFSGITAANLVSVSQNTRLSGCTFRNNNLSDAVFSVSAAGTDGYLDLTIDNCRGSDNTAWAWTRTDAGCMILDAQGNALDEDTLDALFGSVTAPVAAPTAPQETVTVTTVDEFLAAIGPNKDIVIDCKDLNLSTAADYGKNGASPYYSWSDPLDGPQLTILNVDNLTIRGKDGKDSNTVSAVPRYAQVLSFWNCTNLSVKDLTAGHTEEPGECSGGVLEFQNCSAVSVSGTGLFGCGTIGIQAYRCKNIDIDSNEIYDCSAGGVQLGTSRQVTMTHNSFHDIGSSRYGFIYDVSADCDDITFNGTTVAPGDYLAAPGVGEAN